MYSLLTHIGLTRSLRKELVPFAIALLIAQLFFKWGSFGLELIGFLVVWWGLGLIADKVTGPSSRG